MIMCSFHFLTKPRYLGAPTVMSFPMWRCAGTKSMMPCKPLIGPACLYRLTRRMQHRNFKQNSFLSISLLSNQNIQHKSKTLSKRFQLQIKLWKAWKIFNKTGKFPLLMQDNCLKRDILMASEVICALGLPNPVQKTSHIFAAQPFDYSGLLHIQHLTYTVPRWHCASFQYIFPFYSH